MARQWSVSCARSLIQKWGERRIDQAIQLQGLRTRLEDLEIFVIEQQPVSLVEAERLLDLIVQIETEVPDDLKVLYRVGGGVRNDLGQRPCRVEVSFAPCASGPVAGRT